MADLDILLSGTPKNDDIPPLVTKSDDVLPAKFTDLLAFQSPVRSQGSRGVCSIFSTVGLMENLYIMEGSNLTPDFSEQYLQWSAKFQVGSFPNTSGSTATSNLQAVSQFGIVDEATYPFENIQWGPADDAACDGESDQPTRCYTNGHPSDAVKNATKYYLPHSKWLRARDVKAHMHQEQTGVIVGLDFFYQSWNHRASKLPVNSDSWNQGFVVYPSQADKTESSANRAGHSILLVGWDDEQEMPTLDEDGNVAKDADGNDIMETGCYVFKNSWGTSGFGLGSNWGPGYGCISYRYVNEYGSLRTTGLPVIEQVTEVCGDELDNDGNGDTDCDDEACAEEFECQTGDYTVLEFTGEGELTIPDNDDAGVESSIEIIDEGTIVGLHLDLDISHSYRGDLTVTLHRGEQAVVLHNRTGAASDDLQLSIDLADFNGTALAGEYRLVVTDTARADNGTLNSWGLKAYVNTKATPPVDL